MSQGDHHLVPHLLFFFKRANKIGRLCGLGWQQHKDSELQCYALVSKRKLVNNVDNVVSYTVLHNSTNVLCSGPLGSNVVKEIRLIGKEAKGHAYKYLKIIKKSINPTLHAWVVIKRIAVKIAEFRDVPL